LLSATVSDFKNVIIINMSNETQSSTQSSSQLMKTLAVFGFLAVIIFGTWLAVQIVRMVPGTFASLASLAESVQLGRQEQNNITIESSDSVINSEEGFTVAWSDLKRDGKYTFEYQCTEGVSLNLKVDGEIVPVACGTQFMLPEDTFTVDAQFTSAKKRFVDVVYEIGFIKDKTNDIAFSSAKTITIANATLPSTVAITDTKPKPEVAGVTDTEVKPVAPKPANPTTPVKPTTYTVSELVAPVSDPKGSTDLATKFVAVGTMTSDNKFVKDTSLENGKRNAIQFEVKNIGTKTSTNWTFEAKLPNGETFKSKTQNPLKPNERAVLTIAFGTDAGEEGTEKVTIKVTGGGDTKTANNTFTTSVKITD
jgi:hypothetical protein